MRPGPGVGKHLIDGPAKDKIKRKLVEDRCRRWNHRRSAAYAFEIVPLRTIDIRSADLVHEWLEYLGFASRGDVGMSLQDRLHQCGARPGKVNKKYDRWTFILRDPPGFFRGVLRCRSANAAYTIQKVCSVPIMIRTPPKRLRRQAILEDVRGLTSLIRAEGQFMMPVPGDVPVFGSVNVEGGVCGGLCCPQEC